MDWKLAWTITALIVVTTAVIVAALLSLRDRSPAPTFPGWHVEMWNICHGYRVELRFESSIILGRLTLRNYIVDQRSIEIDPSISREHCMLYEQEDTLLAWNLSAVNPMVVNGYRVNVPVCLQPGDRMELGNSTFLITRVERTAV